MGTEAIELQRLYAVKSQRKSPLQSLTVTEAIVLLKESPSSDMEDECIITIQKFNDV